MSTIENLAERYTGRYRWTSTTDHDGDNITATNCVHTPGIVISAGRPGTYRAAQLDAVEARELALAILDLLDGECPAAGQE